MEEKKEEVTKEEPKVLEVTSEDKIKVKKPKKKTYEDVNETIKIDLSKPAENVTKADIKESIVEEQPIVEITEEVKLPTAPPQPDMPESVQKVVEFMKDTGGDLKDYMNLNRDFDSFGDDDLLRSYYKETKPHLENDEIDFLVQDNFDWDEEIDNEKDVKRKKLALKEQVASAKSHLDGLKSKYYQDIKAGSKLTEEQQKAIDFFGRHNKEEAENKEVADKQKSSFLNKTENVFNDKFKGFEYNVGDKKYRFNVNNAGEVKDTQSDINNFVKKFLNKKNEMSDAKGYHKSLYTAMNADAVANHFYEQGKADAMKNSVAKAKNVDMNPRQSHGTIETGGTKFKVLGDNSSDFKFKIKNNKFKK